MGKEAYNLYGFRPLNPNNAEIAWWPVAATQTLHEGDPIYLNSGAVTVVTSNSTTTVSGVMAADSVLADTGTLVPVYWKHGTVFKARAASASAETVGSGYDVSGTTGAFELNNAASTQHLFICLGTEPGDTAATDCRNLLCTFNPAHHTFGIGV